MKTTLLAFVALAAATCAVRADSAVPSRLGLAPILTSVTAPARGSQAFVPSLTLAQETDAAAVDLKLEPGTANFAQLDTSSPGLPLSSGFILALVAIFVLALRVLGLNHARAMAEHERDSYRGKARMYRALHEDGGADH